MSLRAMLNTSATIARKTEGQSATTGETTATWSSVATGVACAVQVSTASEDRTAARETGRTRYRVFFEYGTDVRSGDRLTWGSRTLTVLGMPSDEAGRLSHYLVVCEEVEGGGTL